MIDMITIVNRVTVVNIVIMAIMVTMDPLDLAKLRQAVVRPANLQRLWNLADKPDGLCTKHSTPTYCMELSWYYSNIKIMLVIVQTYQQRFYSKSVVIPKSYQKWKDTVYYVIILPEVWLITSGYYLLLIIIN